MDSVLNEITIAACSFVLYETNRPSSSSFRRLIYGNYFFSAYNRLKLEFPPHNPKGD